MGWSVFNSYQRWVAKGAADPLLPGPAYVPVGRGVDAGRPEPVSDVHGSPSKHTRHGTPYSSYGVGRSFLGRIPSARLRKPSPSISQERMKAVDSEDTFAWPSRSTASLSRPRTSDSTRFTRTATMIPDDPFISAETDMKSSTVVPVSRTSTLSTFAHSSRFGELWSDEEGDENAPALSPTLPTDEEVEARMGLLEKVGPKPNSVKGKKRNEEVASESTPRSKVTPRKSSWNFHWIPGSPSTRPESYTAVPTRTTSPRSQSFRTPESSPRKPSYARSSGNVRMVDTSILPASPPTLKSPRLESELFVNAAGFDVSRTPVIRRKRSSRPDRDEDQSNKSPSSPSQPGTKPDSKSGLGKTLSMASVSTISEFPGDPPPKRTPAERFYARHSALGKVEEIIQNGRSQSPGRSTLDTVEEGEQFGRAGKDFESVGIEQRLSQP